MSKTLPILVFVAAVLAALMATVVSGTIVALVPLVGVAAAVFLLLLRHRAGYIAGGFLLVACLVALSMSIGDINYKGSGPDTRAETGHTVAVASAVFASMAIMGIAWTRLEPMWMPYVWLVVNLVALGLTFGLGGDYGNPLAGGNYATAFFVVLAAVPALLIALKGEPDLSA